MIELRRSIAIADVRSILTEPRDIELGAFEIYPRDVLEKRLAQYPSRASTIFDDGKPVMAGGVTQTHRAGVCAAWFVSNRNPMPYVRLMWPEAKAIIGGALARGYAIVTDVVPGQDVAERFVRKLGFQRVPSSAGQSTLQFYLAGKQS